MEEVLQKIENYKKDNASYVAPNEEAVEAFRIKYLGSRGIVSDHERNEKRSS